jgi:hypothetical protein
LTKEEKFPKEKFCYFGLRTNVRKIFVKRNLKKKKKKKEKSFCLSEFLEFGSKDLIDDPLTPQHKEKKGKGTIEQKQKKAKGH